MEGFFAVFYVPATGSRLIGVGHMVTHHGGHFDWGPVIYYGEVRGGGYKKGVGEGGDTQSFQVILAQETLI